MCTKHRSGARMKLRIEARQIYYGIAWGMATWFGARTPRRADTTQRGRSSCGRVSASGARPGMLPYGSN